ncbi:MAG: hypothetical protein WC785_09065 [Tatlockia sp.]|jgi:hypothetical protein
MGTEKPEVPPMDDPPLPDSYEPDPGQREDPMPNEEPEQEPE